jgi:hypothetical protein
VHNLLDPAILFFVFGVFAGLIRSNLEIPPAIAKFLSLYLLMALGLKGGFSLAATGLNAAVLASLGAAMLMAVVVPALGYAFLQRVVPRMDAAAVAAAYGSVSAVTFVAAMQYVEHQGIPAGGHMAVAMVLMESPAIIMAVLLANRVRAHAHTGSPVAAAGAAPVGNTSIRHILKEAFTDGTHLLLLGALAVGWITGAAGKTAMQPFSGDIYKGMLAFFLLDMGLTVARNFGAVRGRSPVLIGYAVVAPAVHAMIALGFAVLLQLPVGDAALLMILSASASYIVVPAVLRYAIPEANPSLYFGLSIGVTVPMNILVGIPLYTAIARMVLG